MSSTPATSTDSTPSAGRQPTADALTPGRRVDLRVESGLEQATVCVLLGGRSSEREVSLASGKRIADALRTPSSESDRRGPKRVFEVEIRADGLFVVDGQALSPAAALDALENVDIFFSGLHGGDGEGGTLQGLFTACGCAFTGTGVLGSAVGIDKVFTRELVRAQGLRVAPAECVDQRDWNDRADEIVASLAAWKGSGWAIKPRCGGSSVAMTLTRDPGELFAGIERALAEEDSVLIEGLIEGVEVTGAVLETPDRGLEALPVVEIRPKPGRFFDYEEKYSSGGAIEVCPPESVSDATCDHIRRESLLAHRTLRCDGYSRSDFIVPSDGSAPVFLELNTLPGMTPRSLFPRAARTANIDYRTLCLWIASAARPAVPSSDSTR